MADREVDAEIRCASSSIAAGIGRNPKLFALAEEKEEEQQSRSLAVAMAMAMAMAKLQDRRRIIAR
jgi:hypothetical protein